MITINKYVDNIKCNGCATRIVNKLSALPEVDEVVIDIENDLVSLKAKNKSVEEEAEQLLSKMGYPPKGSSTTLQTAKSYVSCMIGRMQAE